MVVLYYLPLSPPCRSVMLLAKEIGVELELKDLDLFKGEHMKPWYLDLSPQHTIPTITDGDFALSESRAILQYLQNQYGKDESLYPADPKKRAVVDHRLNFDMGILVARFRDYFFPVVFRDAPHFTSESRQRIEEALEMLDKYIEKSGGWAAGPNKTIADFSLAAIFENIAQLRGIHRFDLSKYKNVSEWHAKCKSEIKDYEDINVKGALIWVESLFEKKAGDKEIK